jgi:hypothetical protein
VADWEVDSPRLRNNLLEVLRDARDRAVRRIVPTVEDARRWQRDTMAGLDVPDTEYVGRFRGEPGLETTRVWIGSHEGVRPGEVARELAAFHTPYSEQLRRWMRAIRPDRNSMETVSPPSSICAWTHAEWVRIHPFGNGNGRTARIWANALLMRYGLPPVVRLRPRPDRGYGRAGVAAMEGNWRPTAAVFRRMLGEPFMS